MRKLCLLSIVTLFVLSCTVDKFKATIEGDVAGLKKGEIILKVLEVNNQRTIDTIKVESEKFRYTITGATESSDFYYLFYKERKIASLFVMPGDKITINSDTLGSEITVKGSNESELLVSLEKRLVKSQRLFDSLRNEMVKANSLKDVKKAEELNYELGSVYVKQKQEAIKYIYSNPGSITNMILLYYKFSQDIPLFADLRDVLLFRKVYDSLQVNYPKSIYIQRLMDEISGRERSEVINSKILDASERGYPDLTLPDTKAQPQSLSQLSGKVILLSFWSVNDVSLKMLNTEYLELYRKYNSKGLEIYQISVDTDKTAWARAVAEQQLPWISVCDGFGANSPSISTYNVQKLPANFIIDRSGSIIARDIYDKALENKISSLLR